MPARILTPAFCGERAPLKPDTWVQWVLIRQCVRKLGHFTWQRFSRGLLLQTICVCGCRHNVLAEDHPARAGNSPLKSRSVRQQNKRDTGTNSGVAKTATKAPQEKTEGPPVPPSVPPFFARLAKCSACSCCNRLLVSQGAPFGQFLAAAGLSTNRLAVVLLKQ